MQRGRWLVIRPYSLSNVGWKLSLSYTRPDISYAVQQVSQFMTSPRHLHMVLVRWIIRYVHDTSLWGLFYLTGTLLNLIAYNDVDYVSCSDTRVLLQVNVCFLVWLLFIEKARNRTVFLSVLLNLNIGPCPKLALR
jgi:hypothetical protein